MISDSRRSISCLSTLTFVLNIKVLLLRWVFTLSPHFESSEEQTIISKKLAFNKFKANFCNEGKHIPRKVNGNTSREYFECRSLDLKVSAFYEIEWIQKDNCKKKLDRARKSYWHYKTISTVRKHFKMKHFIKLNIFCYF